MDSFLHQNRKRLIIVGVIVLLLTLGSLAFISVQSAEKEQTQTPQAIKTAEVIVGDLTAEVSGTGSIVAPNAVDLVFSTTGKVAELNVDPGNTVTEGDVLARLDRISALQMNVDSAKLTLSKAQKTLDDLEANKEITLANALTAQSEAAEALEKAQKGKVNKYTGRCEKSVTENYYMEYMYSRGDYLYWARFLEGGSGYGEMYIRQNMAPYEQEMRTNYANWKYCEGYSELEINQSIAAVELAQSTYDKAKEYYETLKTNDGIDPDEQTVAEMTKKDAELKLEEARKVLDGATLTSPIDGTVLSVAASVGEILDKDTYKSPYIKIADLSEPVLKASFDETDLASITVGCPAKVSFSSLQNRIYDGSIFQIDPALTENNSVSSVTAYINLVKDDSAEITNLPVGLNATVELTCTLADDVLLVPLQALKDENAGKAQVYVMNADNTSTARTVEIVQKSMTYAEITGDLKAGDKVITSAIQ